MIIKFLLNKLILQVGRRNGGRDNCKVQDHTTEAPENGQTTWLSASAARTTNKGSRLAAVARRNGSGTDTEDDETDGASNYDIA